MVDFRLKPQVWTAHQAARVQGVLVANMDKGWLTLDDCKQLVRDNGLMYSDDDFVDIFERLTDESILDMRP